MRNPRQGPVPTHPWPGTDRGVGVERLWGILGTRGLGRRTPVADSRRCLRVPRVPTESPKVSPPPTRWSTMGCFLVDESVRTPSR